MHCRGGPDGPFMLLNCRLRVLQPLTQRIQTAGSTLEPASSKGYLANLVAHGTAYLLYLVGWAAVGGSDLVTVPLLARLMPQSEFGKYFLAFGTFVFLSDLFSIWSSSFLVRQTSASTGPDYDARIKAQLLLATVLMSTAGCAIATAAAVLAWVAGFGNLVMIFAIGCVLVPASASITVALGESQAKKRSRKYAVLSILRLVGVAGGGFAGTLAFGKTAEAFLGSATALAVLAIGYVTPAVMVFSRDELRANITAGIKFGFGVWFQNAGAKVLRIGDQI